ncbi:amidohydrolase family protein [Frisingicoccus sp.]|uniref:amidohydrolase family protein n=1 Tax=Frisingicoccus sp. TaxID=1918627 RepID=UPI00386999B8
MKNFVLKGNILYSKNSDKIEEYPDSYLVCEEGISRGVFRSLPEQYKNLPLKDYGEKLIIPGLVDLHIHAPQYAYRGMGMDLELMDWLQQQAFPEEAKYIDLEYAKKAYGIFAQQMKISATTRASIFATRHSEATKLLMELLEDTGLMTYVGKVNMDNDAPENLIEESADISAAHTIEWLDGIEGRFQRTKPILTPRFIPSCTKALLKKLQQIRTDYDLPVQSHLSENPGEIAFVKELFPEAAFYGDCYDRYDLFGQKPGSPLTKGTIMAHCVYSGDEEIALMKQNGVFIAHCPASNMNISSGIAPVRKYMEQGLHMGLGSDVAGGQTESMFRAMTDAIQMSKMYWRLVDDTKKPLTFDEAFYLATKGGGAFFGKVGSFEEGYELDALVLNDEHLPHPQKLTLHQRLERFAYLGGDVQGIVSKYVAGQCILKEQTA